MSRTTLLHERENDVSAAIQDYCKAIHMLSERDRPPVSTSSLSARLGVSPASASAMLKRLEDLGLATREPYRGARLTEAGSRVALETIRHHRLVELFLHEIVGMPWDEVHDEAEVLEHAISERLEALIAEKLGDPKFDPHGDPIPSIDGQVAERSHAPLSSMNVGANGVLVRISDSDPEMLRYLADRGIAPGDRLAVTAQEPFGGSITVKLESTGSIVLLGDALARAMRIHVERPARRAR